MYEDMKQMSTTYYKLPRTVTQWLVSSIRVQKVYLAVHTTFELN